MLSDLPPAIGRIVHTLLTAESRLSQCELAGRAAVSVRTVRNYRDRLEALSLIHVDENGYRLALPIDHNHPLGSTHQYRQITGSRRPRIGETLGFSESLNQLRGVSRGPVLVNFSSNDA
nr:HTH domain-containing protein [Natronococcus amylolyticus]